MLETRIELASWLGQIRVVWADLEADFGDDDAELIARIVFIGAALDDTLERVNMLILDPGAAV